MTRARGQKADLFKWVNDQQALDMRTKFILRELAGYADGNCVAWCKVETLAYAANCTERTVFNHLSALKEAGLIVDTGRTHRLDDSTRSVPLWQLAPHEPGLGQPWSAVAAGAGEGDAGIPENISGIGGSCMKSGGGIPETGFHPVGYKGLQESSDELSPSASVREALFVEMIAACPRSMLKFADRDKARGGFEDLCDQGYDVADLPACLKRMAADPAWKSRKHPPQLDTWIAKRQFEGWPAEGQLFEARSPSKPAAALAKAPEAEAATWAAVMAQLSLALGEADFSYIDAARLDVGPGGELLVVAFSSIARDRIRDRTWKRLAAAWLEADERRRPIRLVTKGEFEALARQDLNQSQGVG